MKRKGKLWMADWRDAQGKRHRKGFTNRMQAIRFKNQMQEEAKRKKASAQD